MKLNINFLQTGGVPLTNDLMGNVMEAIQLYDALGSLAGDKTILAGCEEIGNTVTEGVVAIDGVCYYFEGGVKTMSVFIKKTSITKTFEDQLDKVLIERNSVKFGLSTNNFVWSEFKKLPTIKEIAEKVEAAALQTDLDDLELRVAELEKKTAPIINGGVVFPWRKPVNEIPQGWKECTDFRGKVIVGQDPNDVDFAQMGLNLGEKKHQLDNAELPKVEGTFNTVNINTQSSTGVFQDVSATNAQLSGSAVGMVHRGIKFSYGNNQAHNNIQPSRIAMYIEPDF